MKTRRFIADMKDQFFLPFFTIILFLVAAINLSLIVWSLNKGFDFTDEAWAYSLVKSGRDTVNEPWGFHWVLNPIYDLFGQSVLAFRYLRLIAYFILGLLTFHVLRRSVNFGLLSNKYRNWILFPATQIGTFVAFSYAPPYISYNELSAWLVQIIGILLISLNSSNNRVFLKWGLIGFYLGILSVSKISSFLLVAISLLFILIFYRTCFVTNILVCFSGFVSACLLLVLFAFPFNAYFRNNFTLFTDKELQTEYAHPISGMVKKYLIDVVYFPSRYPLVIAIFVLFVISILFKNKLNAIFVNVVFAVGFLASFILLREELRWNQIGAFIFLCILVNLTFAAVRFLKPDQGSKRSLPEISVVFFATLSPLFAGFGTSNPILGQMLFASTLLFGILALNLLVFLGTKCVFPISVLSLWSLVFVLIATLQAPYGNQDLTKSKFSTSAEDLSGIKVESNRQARINAYVDMKKYVADLSLISIDNPGALFLSSNDNFANPWINYKTWPASFLSIDSACQGAQKNEIGIFIDSEMAEDEKLLARLNTSLRSCSLQFPNDFEILKSYDIAEFSSDQRLWVTR